MKKILVVLCAGILVCFMAGGALGYTFGNETYVQEWNKNSIYGSWKDRIETSGQTYFENYGADLTGSLLSLYTNFPEAGHPTLKDPRNPSYNLPVADLFIDLIGTTSVWDYAVVLANNSFAGTTKGQVYQITSTHTPGVSGSSYFPNATNPTRQFNYSQDIYYNVGSSIYGGRYDSDLQKGSPYTPAPVPTEVIKLYATSVTPTSVVWNTLASPGQPNYKIDIDLSFLSGKGNYCFIQGAGICANDTIQGCVVPIPGAVLLLGAGLARLAAYARRRKEV